MTIAPATTHSGIVAEYFGRAIAALDGWKAEFADDLRRARAEDP